MGEVTLDSTIYIRPSKQLLQLIEDIQDLPTQIRDAVDRDDGLTVDMMKSVHRLIDKNDKKKLSEALQNSNMKLPSPKYPERNPELEARCQKLRRAQEEREYRELTKNVRSLDKGDEAPLSVQMKELNAILIALLQFVVSVACAFTFGYLAPYYFYGSTNTGGKILCGTFVAFLVGLADLYFVIRDSLHNEGYILKKIE